MNTTIERQVRTGETVEITKRRLQDGKVLREVFRGIVIEVLKVEEVYRAGVGVVTKSECVVAIS
jgi:hypothetical protein